MKQEFQTWLMKPEQKQLREWILDRCSDLGIILRYALIIGFIFICVISVIVSYPSISAQLIAGMHNIRILITGGN